MSDWDMLGLDWSEWVGLALAFSGLVWLVLAYCCCVWWNSGPSIGLTPVMTKGLGMKW